MSNDLALRMASTVVASIAMLVTMMQFVLSILLWRLKVRTQRPRTEV